MAAFELPPFVPQHTFYQAMMEAEQQVATFASNVKARAQQAAAEIKAAPVSPHVQSSHAALSAQARTVEQDSSSHSADSHLSERAAIRGSSQETHVDQYA